MKIKLDANMMPIWPGGIVPPHPRDADGKPILLPPGAPPLPLRSGTQPILPDRLTELEMRIAQLQLEINELKSRLE